MLAAGIRAASANRRVEVVGLEEQVAADSLLMRLIDLSTLNASWMSPTRKFGCSLQWVLYATLVPIRLADGW